MYNSILSFFVFGFMAFSKGDHTHIVLQLLKECGYKVFDVWNLKYTYCGSVDNTNLFRHDYIDHFDPACVSHLSVIYEGKDKLHLRYDNPVSNVLEDILRRKPDYGSPRTPLAADNYMTNTNNRYEFLWLNNLNKTIYAGIYHSTDTSKAPAFVYNVQTNSPYKANENPTGFNDINSANDLHIELSIKDSCSFSAATTKQGSCPGKRKPRIHTTQTTVDVLQGSNVTLDCSYTAYGLATSVEWEFIAPSSSITNAITQNTNLYKYSGATVYLPSLTIYNFASTDVGQYKCTATNDKGRGEGSNIQLLIILASTLPPTTETTLVTSVSQSTTQEPTSTTDNNLDSTTVSSIPRTTDTTLVTSERQTTTQEPTSTFYNDLDTTTASTLPQMTDTTLVTSESQSTIQESASTLDNNLDSTTVPGTTASSVMNSGISELNTSGDSNWTTTYSTVSSTGTDTDKCPCSCEYKQHLEYWMTQNGTNYTMDELRIILEPRLSSIKEDLKIDRKSLASFKNTLNSAPDDRSSSKSLGIVGITVLVSIFVIIVVMDISTLKQCKTLRRTSKQ